jgi:hypothetical protein
MRESNTGKQKKKQYIKNKDSCLSADRIPLRKVANLIQSLQE